METILSAEGAPTPVGPYSLAVKVGNFAFCSGQIPVDPDSGQIVDGGIEPQTEQVLKNLSAVLRSVNSTWSNVCMATIFLKDLSHFSAVNQIYQSKFTNGQYPARQTVGVTELPRGVLVEISLITKVSSSI